MLLTHGTTLDAALAMTVVLTKYDPVDSLIPRILVAVFCILEVLLSSCVLGMPFFSAYNPRIN